MNVPTAVKKAEERAEALQKSLKEGKPQEKGITPETGTPANENRDTSPDSQKSEVKTEEAPKEVDFQQKYQSLKGKFDAEMPRLHQELKRLQQTVSELQHKNSELVEATEKQKQQEESKVEGLDPKDFAEYGEEFESLVTTIQRLQTQNAELKGQIEQVSGDAQSQAQADYTVYMDSLKKALSDMGVDFEQINHDPAFLNFLRQFPENGTQSRHTSLLMAEKSRNLGATIDIFKEYLGNISQQKEPQPQPQPNVQPTTQSPGTDINPPEQQNTNTWSRAEISAFYNDLNSGEFKGREDEAKAYEADIYLAQKQGRIVA